MNYTKMLTATAIVFALFATSCQKETFHDFPINQNAQETQVSNLREGDENNETVVIGFVQIDGGITNITNGTVTVFDVNNNLTLETLNLDANNEFRVSLADGLYTFTVHNNGDLVGTSDVMQINATTPFVTLDF